MNDCCSSYPCCLFLLGRCRHKRKTSIGKSSIGKSSYSCEGTYSIRNTSTNYRSCKRSRCRDLMHRCRLLLGSKTSCSSIVKSSLESSPGSSNLLSISKIFSSNLSSLSISIYRSKSSMIPSFSSSKSSIDLSLGSSNICSVLNRERGGSSQQGDNHQFIHVELLSCSRKSSESTPM